MKPLGRVGNNYLLSAHALAGFASVARVDYRVRVQPFPLVKLVQESLAMRELNDPTTTTISSP